MRGKRWKMDVRRDRIMKTERNSCTEVKLLRARRRSEAKITLPSPPTSETDVCIYKYQMYSLI